jgi:adenylate cyclase
MAKRSAQAPHARTEEPDTGAVEAELERILNSRCFEQAGRASEFLRFVVRETLAGNGDRLKGYTIGIEVFGRPETFDAQSDPLVRVEAGRLRRRLIEYYVAEGRANPIRIALPRGGYTAAFAWAPNTAASTPARRARNKPLRRMSAAILAAVVGALAMVIMQREWDRSADGESAAAPAGAPLSLPTGPKILVLPFENLSGDPSLDYFADGMTEEIMVRLSDFELFVIASQTTWSYRNERSDLRSLGAELDARYILTGSVRNIPERARVSARLLHGDTGAQLWTAAYDENLSVQMLLSIQERIAREVVATIAVPYGPIFEQELARTGHKAAEHLDTYDCVLKYHYYRRTNDPLLHRETVECFQRAVAKEPEFADAWAGLALLYLDEHGFGYSPQLATADPLERAREAARTAMDIDGENYFANLSMARIRFFSGDLAGFRRSADRVLSLNPNNAEALALIGTLLAVSGATEGALPLVEKAIALSPQPPRLYYLAHAVVDLRAGNAEQALTWALRMDAPNWFITPVVVAATAALAGREDVARRSAERVLELYPGFPDHARSELAKWQLDEPLLDAMLRGLRAAGLDIR